MAELLCWFLILFIIYCIGFKFIEGVDWSEAVWQGWQTFTTVGYGNRPAETLAGRILTMTVSTLGIAIVGAVFAAGFDLREYYINKKKFGFMENPFKDAYVIFNFPGEHKALRFIDEIRSIEKDAGICFIDGTLEKLPERIALRSKIHFIKGNTLDRSTFEKSKLKENKVVIVFPLTPDLPDSDGATKTLVSIVSKFIDPLKTRIIHVLVNSDNAWMFEGIPSTQVLESVEMFCVVQESQDPYSSGILEQLMMNSEGGNPRTVNPKRVVGLTWGQLQRILLEYCHEHNFNINPFALVKDGKVITCPPLNTTIGDGDSISIITRDAVDWEKLEQGLKL